MIKIFLLLLSMIVLYSIFIITLYLLINSIITISCFKNKFPIFSNILFNIIIVILTMFFEINIGILIIMMLLNILSLYIIYFNDPYYFCTDKYIIDKLNKYAIDYYLLNDSNEYFVFMDNLEKFTISNRYLLLAKKINFPCKKLKYLKRYPELKNYIIFTLTTKYFKYYAKKYHINYLTFCILSTMYAGNKNKYYEKMYKKNINNNFMIYKNSQIYTNYYFLIYRNRKKYIFDILKKK